MHPVLISFSKLTISSFGTMLAIGLLAAIYVVWKIAKTYDIDQEKIIDIALLTFLGGLIFARLVFVALDWSLFGDIEKVVMINRYPGLSFWGGLIGGTISFWFFSRRAHLNFWQIADFAVVGLLIGLIFGNIGCFLGGCGYGIASSSPLALSVVGLLGKRLPVSILETLLLIIIFFSLKSQVVRFHFNGKITAYFLIIVGLIKFITEFYRGDRQYLPIISATSLGSLLSVLMVFLGIYIYYSRSKRKLLIDLLIVAELFYKRKRQMTALSNISKSWYNFTINWRLFWSKALARVDLRLRLPKRKQYVKSP